MTNFEKITASPETLGTFLASLPIASGPWDEAFHRTFCDGCQAEDCDGQDCPHKAERNNPLWWLMQEAEVEQDTPPLERRPMWRGGRLDMEPDHGTSREGWKEWPSEPHRTEKLFEEIKAKIIESGCTPDEGINVLGSLQTVCIDNLKREKNPPRP